MKDKAEVLMQVDQLTQVKDELTEQVKSPWQLLVLNIVSNLRRSKYTRTSLIGYNLLFDLQVAELTAELEKERSKVHSLKSEVDKFKVIRFCLSKKISTRNSSVSGTEYNCKLLSIKYYQKQTAFGFVGRQTCWEMIGAMKTIQELSEL